MSKQTKYPICLYPECERQQVCRGFCISHHRQIQLFVKDGKTTWATLEAGGKALPKKRAGRRSGDFQAWALGKTAEVA